MAMTRDGRWIHSYDDLDSYWKYDPTCGCELCEDYAQQMMDDQESDWWEDTKDDDDWDDDPRYPDPDYGNYLDD